MSARESKVWAPEGIPVVWEKDGEWFCLHVSPEKYSYRHQSSICLVHLPNTIGIRDIEIAARVAPFFHAYHSYHHLWDVWKNRDKLLSIEWPEPNPVFRAVIKILLGREPFWPCCWMGKIGGADVFISVRTHDKTGLNIVHVSIMNQLSVGMSETFIVSEDSIGPDAKDIASVIRLAIPIIRKGYSVFLDHKESLWGVHTGEGVFWFSNISKMGFHSIFNGLEKANAYMTDVP